MDTNTSIQYGKFSSVGSFCPKQGKISQSGEQFFKTTSGVNYRPNREISPHIKSDLLIRRQCTLL